MRQCFRRYAFTAIAHAQYGQSVHFFDLHLDNSAVGTEANRIVQQITENLSDRGSIQYRYRRFGVLNSNFDVTLRRLWRLIIDNCTRKVRYVGWLDTEDAFAGFQSA